MIRRRAGNYAVSDGGLVTVDLIDISQDLLKSLSDQSQSKWHTFNCVAVITAKYDLFKYVTLPLNSTMRNGITSCSRIVFFWRRWKELKMKIKNWDIFLILCRRIFFYCSSLFREAQRISLPRGKNKQKDEIGNSRGSTNLSRPLIRRRNVFFPVFLVRIEFFGNETFSLPSLPKQSSIREVFFPRDLSSEFSFLWQQSGDW